MKRLSYLGNTKFTATGIYLSRLQRHVDINFDKLDPLVQDYINKNVKEGILSLEEVSESNIKLATGNDINRVIARDMSRAIKPIMSRIVEEEVKLVKIKV